MEILATFVFASTEGESEPSKALYYIVGGVTVAFALLISVFGMSRPDWPENANMARLMMLVSVVLGVAVSASIIITA